MKTSCQAAFAILRAQAHAKNGAAMQSSAELNLADANTAMANGNFDGACRFALRSLSYSVGVFHTDYKAVANGNWSL